MPLLTTQSARGYGWGAGGVVSDHVLIATRAGGGSSITFADIPQSYDHLQLYWNARTTGSNTGSNSFILEIFLS